MIGAHDTPAPFAPESARRWEALAGAAAHRAEQHLRSRQSPSGGFCFYRWGGVEEPSLADTWHAVASFALLGVPVPRCDAVVTFVQHFSVTGLDDLYHATRTLSLLGAKAKPDATSRANIAVLDANAVLTNARVPVSGRLEHALRIAELQRGRAVLRRPAAIAEAVATLRHEGGWGEKGNLEDTWRALALLALCGAAAGMDSTRNFVDSLQVPSFGFTATRDSSFATLDVVHAGVRACRLLGIPLCYGDDVVDFVLACQSETGGFARTPDALPNIALTHRGLLILAAAGLLPAPVARSIDDDFGY